MAISTIELRKLLNLTNFNLWDFPLPVDDLLWADRIKKTIEDYFFFHEIGSETPDRFKHRLQTKLNLILPYYNQLYNTTLLDYNPLVNYSVDETITEQGDEERSTTNATDATNTSTNTMSQENETRSNNVVTDHPQHIDVSDDIPSQRNVTDTRSDGTSNTTTQDNGTSESVGNENVLRNKTYTKKLEGLTGQSYSKLILEKRESIINIEQMIINDLKSLFLLVY